MLFLLDNYDSFTYNLVQYFEMLGQTVQVMRNDQVSVEQVIQLAPQYIVISPGPGTPQQTGIAKSLLDSFAGKIPILGVCLGHQCIAEYFGAKIIHAPQLMHGKTSPVYHQATGLFQGLPCPMQVTRYHSLVVSNTNFPDCLSITAWTEELSQQTIMGLAHKTLPIMGVQFHPESILTQAGLALLDNFIQQSVAPIAD